MRLTTLTLIAFDLNSAIDFGRYDDLGIDEVKSQIDAGTIFTFFERESALDMDLSILGQEDEAELVAEWQDLLAAVNERRKMGIEMRGLTLLVAYLLKGIQRRK